MKKVFLACMVAIASMSVANAQKLVVQSGDVSALRGQKGIKLEYVYDGMSVGKFRTEKEYTDQKVTEYNKKEAGKGDKFLASWSSARTERYQPKFEDLMDKVIGDKMKIQDASAKYTIIVTTTKTEPGFNIGIMRQPAYVDFDFKIVESANHSKVIASLYVINVIGAQAMGFDYDAGSRIAESYAKAGKILAKYLEDKLY
jgi:hypothetical protein